MDTKDTKDRIQMAHSMASVWQILICLYTKGGVAQKAPIIKIKMEMHIWVGLNFLLTAKVPVAIPLGSTADAIRVIYGCSLILWRE